MFGEKKDQPHSKCGFRDLGSRFAKVIRMNGIRTRSRYQQIISFSIFANLSDLWIRL